MPGFSDPKLIVRADSDLWPQVAAEDAAKLDNVQVDAEFLARRITESGLCFEEAFLLIHSFNQLCEERDVVIALETAVPRPRVSLDDMVQLQLLETRTA